MVAPVRFTSGVTQQAPWQPLGDSGFPNPFFYFQVADDFNALPTNNWTITPGTVAPTSSFVEVAGVGGIIQSVSAATIASGAAVSKGVASFQLTAVTDAGNSPKVFFYTSLSASLIANTQILAGLINTVAGGMVAPFTGVTDGIWFSKLNTGGFNLNYQVASGTVQTVAMNVPAALIANSTFIDLSFSVNYQGVIKANIGLNSCGRVPQSGTGANTPAYLSPSVTLTAAAIPLTSVLLNPTVGMWAGTAAANTFSIDYILAAQER